VEDNLVQFQLSEIQYSVTYERENSVTFGDIIRGRASEKAGTKTIRRLLLGVIGQSFQQLTGINVTSYYLPTVLTKSVGLSESLARLLTACNSVQYLFFSFIGILKVEQWGRRKLMMYGCAGCCFCYIFITSLIRYNELSGYTNQKQVASASIAFFFLYYVFFGIGMQGVTWCKCPSYNTGTIILTCVVYATEINSLTMRTKGAALGAATNWIFNFMVVEITPIGIQNLGWRFYLIWTVLNAAVVPIVYFFYPETAGRTLEDMDEYFRSNPPLIVCRNKEAISSKRPAKYRQREKELLQQRDGGVAQHVEDFQESK
jgi:hypothetical protein